LIEESARIVNRTSDPGNPDAGTVPVMIIGNNNVFEVDCTSLALKIGDNNVLESKVKFQMENLKKVLMKSDNLMQTVFLLSFYQYYFKSKI
jgi:hypothetical protein